MKSNLHKYGGTLTEKVVPLHAQPTQSGRKVQKTFNGVGRGS